MMMMMMTTVIMMTVGLGAGPHREITLIGIFIGAGRIRGLFYVYSKLFNPNNC